MFVTPSLEGRPTMFACSLKRPVPHPGGVPLGTEVPRDWFRSEGRYEAPGRGHIPPKVANGGNTDEPF